MRRGFSAHVRILLCCIRRCVALLTLAVLACGCAHEMPLAKGQGKIDTSGNALALLYVKISNINNPNYQPKLDEAVIVRGNDRGTASDMFKPGDPYKSEDNKYNEYLLNFSIEPGDHLFRWLNATIYVPLLFSAHCPIYLNMKLDPKPNTVVYLGHLEALIRPKKDGEESNLPLVPLIDQALAGFSTGRLDATVTDNFDNDMNLFYSQFPGLRNVAIEKMILPTWANTTNKHDGVVSAIR